MTVSRWERAENRPRYEHLVALAQVLKREVAWFYEDHDEATKAAAA